MLVAVPTALSQSAADQYLPALDPAGSTEIPPGYGPPANQETESASGRRDPVARTQAPEPKPKAGSSGGGDAPGSDFPLTPFAIAAFALAGLLLLVRFLRPLLARA
jgi:hypothetical protein